MIRSYPDDKDAVCEVASGLFTTFSADTPDVERFAQVHAYQCSRLRAKPAHLVGHLPQGPLPSVAAPLAAHFCHFITQVPYSRTCLLVESSPQAGASPRRTRVLRSTRRTASLCPRRYTERTPR